MADECKVPQYTEPSVHNIDQPMAAEYFQTYRRLNVGAKCLYWIAALSLLNLALSLSGVSVNLLISSGTAQFLYGMASVFPPFARFITLLVAAMCSSMYGVFGYYGARRKHWALTIGLVLYLLDTTLFLFLQQLVSVAIHLFVAYFIYHAIRANIWLGTLDRNAQGNVGAAAE